VGVLNQERRRMDMEREREWEIREMEFERERERESSMDILLNVLFHYPLKAWNHSHI
jgi:hypothetical protein